MVASVVFKAIRLKSSFFGRPIMGPTWILNTADFQSGVMYEIPGTTRRFEATEIVSEGSDWVWVKPNEMA